MEPRPPPPTVALPLQAKPSFQLFCRWRQPLNPLDPNGHQNNVSPYQYLAIPQGDQLQDRLYASRLWNGSGQRPENVELVARTPDGCEAVLKRYIESFSYDGCVDLFLLVAFSNFSCLTCHLLQQRIASNTYHQAILATVRRVIY